MTSSPDRPFMSLTAPPGQAVETTAPDAPARHVDEFVYDARARAKLRSSLREIFIFRECVTSFASRNLRVRYKQAVLGLGWAVIQPLAFLGIFILFFNKVAGVSGSTGTTYAAFALASLVPWQFVSNSVSFGGLALIVDAAGLLRKVYFPREAPVIGAILAYVPDLFIGIGLVLLAAPITGAHLSWTLIYTPILLVCIALPTLAVTLPIGALTVYYRDFKYALPFLVQLWMFASPVAYPITTIAPRWRPLYAAVNPVVGPLDGFVHVFAAGSSPNWGLLAISAASSCVLLLVGYRVFKSFEREIADVV
jgi:ABC-type polysaccharide/polyol phosphate export permease